MNLSDRKGPTVILNSGSLDHTHLSSMDKFKRYSLKYVVGKGNRSYQELRRICLELCEQHGLKNPKLPWYEDERTNMVSIGASSTNAVPVADSDGKKIATKKATDGEFCKISVTPSAYKVETNSSYITPDGLRHPIVDVKEGVKLFLNGVKMLPITEECPEDLF